MNKKTYKTPEISTLHLGRDLMQENLGVTSQTEPGSDPGKVQSPRYNFMGEQSEDALHENFWEE